MIRKWDKKYRIKHKVYFVAINQWLVHVQISNDNDEEKLSKSTAFCIKVFMKRLIVIKSNNPQF